MTLPPDNRLDGDTPLRQAQLVMLRLLKALDTLCKEEGLVYWLDAGTLLGAARHGGFIPWDDDIDVMMPWDDYQRLYAVAADKLPFDMFFQTGESDPGFPCAWAKIRDRFSHLEEAGGPYPYSQAISIDIFPVVLATEREHRLRAFYALLSPWRRAIEWPARQFSFMSNGKRLATGLVQWVFRALFSLPPLGRALRAWFAKGEKAWEYLPPIRWTNRFARDLVEPLGSIRFEDADFPAPARVDEFLTAYFGDWRTPPPEEQRVSEHAVTAIHPTGPNPHSSGLAWEDYYG